MNLNAELLEKAKLAKSSEELMTVAKANGFDLTGEEAERYFSYLNSKSGELGDDELGDVSGGRRCFTTYYEGQPVVTTFNSCGHYRYLNYETEGEKAGGGNCIQCTYYKCNGWICLCTCPQRYND